MTEASIIPAPIRRFFKGAVLAAAIGVTLSGCASPGAPGAKDAWLDGNDPFEGVNRMVFGINEAADILFIGPASDTYRRVVPDPIQASVQSFTRNLWMPITIANELFQGDIDGAISATGRFITNTILGAGGLADVATQAGIPYESEDFGQTLATWGIGDGPYVVLPLLGPSSLRDAIGTGVDFAGDPVRLWSYGTHHRTEGFAARSAYVVDTRSRVVTEVDDLRKNSVDYYATRRSLYRQMRKAAIEEKKTTASPEYPVFESAPAKKP